MICYNQAWWFVTSLGHRTEPGESLPISYFPSKETQLYKASTEQDAFRGGRGSITLIRYTESPIGKAYLCDTDHTTESYYDVPLGPFDELAIAPGEFVNPYQKPSHRVTRAYVSTPEALVNGKANRAFCMQIPRLHCTQGETIGASLVNSQNLCSRPRWTIQTLPKFASSPQLRLPRLLLRHASRPSSSPSRGSPPSPPVSPFSRGLRCVNLHWRHCPTALWAGSLRSRGGISWSATSTVGARSPSGAKGCWPRPRARLMRTQRWRRSRRRRGWQMVSTFLTSNRTASGCIGRKLR